MNSSQQFVSCSSQALPEGEETVKNIEAQANESKDKLSQALVILMNHRVIL